MELPRKHHIAYGVISVKTGTYCWLKTNVLPSCLSLSRIDCAVASMRTLSDMINVALVQSVWWTLIVLSTSATTKDIFRSFQHIHTNRQNCTLIWTLFAMLLCTFATAIYRMSDSVFISFTQICDPCTAILPHNHTLMQYFYMTMAWYTGVMRYHSILETSI